MKFNKDLVLDYVYGNDICDYDIEKLENDFDFMLEVLKYTKDSNMYFFCSEEIGRAHV